MADDPTTHAGEAALVDRFHRGDPAAFERIVVDHRGAVYRVARRLLRSHEDADEAAQVTFVKAWKALGRFRGESSLRTWLIRIALNVSRSMLAARSRAQPMEGMDQMADASEPADASLGRSEERRRIREAVAKLPPRQREVVILKVFSEMTYADVAAVMALSEGAVKAHLHHAVANLRRRMGIRVVSEAG